VLNLVARDGMNVIAGTIEKIKSLVLVVKGLHYSGRNS
jgi:hypothetical protein